MPSAEAAVWKAPRLYVNEIHLLILKHLLEEQVHVGFSLRREAVTGAVLCFPSTLIKPVDACHPVPAFHSLKLAGVVPAFFLCLINAAGAVTALSLCLAETGGCEPSLALSLPH